MEKFLKTVESTLDINELLPFCLSLDSIVMLMAEGKKLLENGEFDSLNLHDWMEVQEARKRLHNKFRELVGLDIK